MRINISVDVDCTAAELPQLEAVLHQLQLLAQSSAQRNVSVTYPSNGLAAAHASSDVGHAEQVASKLKDVYEDMISASNVRISNPPMLAHCIVGLQPNQRPCTSKNPGVVSSNSQCQFFEKHIDKEAYQKLSSTLCSGVFALSHQLHSHASIVLLSKKAAQDFNVIQACCEFAAGYATRGFAWSVFTFCAGCQRLLCFTKS